jgi:PKD repeat protein
MRYFITPRKFVFLLIGMVISVSCENELDLPEAGSRADTMPPEANFSATRDVNNFDIYTFSNLSTSATTYAWDYGDGNTSTTIDGQNQYAAEGVYTITLTASDALGMTSTFSSDIEVIEPEEPDAIIPVILEASFEDNSLPDGTGDGRDSWRNSDLGGVIQINTSSSVPDGGQAAKFPSDGSRIAYQEIEVTPNTDYTITYSYRLEGAGGEATVAILPGGGYTDLTVAQGAAIVEFTGSVEDYTLTTLNFNSGVSSTVSILIYNANVEARVDNFTAAVQ